MRKSTKLPKTLGKRIQKRRRAIGMTQEEVAEKVGISGGYLGFIEQGRSAPSLEVLEKIARALKTPISDFF